MNRVAYLLLYVALAPSLGHAEAHTSLADIALPEGFSIEVLTDEVPDARSLALGDRQTLFVGTLEDGRVYAVVPQENARPSIITIAEKLKMPNGIAFHDGDLYVAETTRIIRFRDIEDRLENRPEYEVIFDSLPPKSHHGWRYIAFGPGGKLYVTIGAPCNACDKKGYGEIARINADGSEFETVAFGIRNSVGLDWDPDNGELWFTDNGRDMMGDDIPADELNHAPDSGMHFGFPFCHGGDILDPDFGQDRDCVDFIPPAQKLDAHVAPLGMVFYDGDMFPEEYRKQIFIAEHGSWNRSKKIGYRISIVRMNNGQPRTYGVFADGWLKNEEVSGRPVDLLVMPDGSMVVSDDRAGSLYRITYSAPLGDDLMAR